MTDGFNVAILIPRYGVDLNPRVIHAVVSPTNSAIGCWEYVDAKRLESNDIRAGAEWDLSLL